MKFITVEEFYENKNKYDSSGVGIMFRGIPIDIDKFIFELEDESCPPIIAREILDDLINKGERITTVMNRLNFNKLEKNLGEIGIQILLCEPLKDLTNNVDRIYYSTKAFHKLIKNKEYNGVNDSYDKKYDESIRLYEKELNLGIKMFEKYGTKINRKWM